MEVDQDMLDGLQEQCNRMMSEDRRLGTMIDQLAHSREENSRRWTKVQNALEVLKELKDEAPQEAVKGAA